MQRGGLGPSLQDSFGEDTAWVVHSLGAALLSWGNVEITGQVGRPSSLSREVGGGICSRGRCGPLWAGQAPSSRSPQSRWGRKEKPREPVPRPWQSWCLMPRPLVYAKRGHSRGRAAPGQLLEPRASTLTPRARAGGAGSWREEALWTRIS